MRAELRMNSSDFEVSVFDDLYITFYDADTSSKVQVVLPDHIAKKFIKELNCKS